jgi:hypothetical protein
MPTLTISAGEGGTTVPTPGPHDYVLGSLVTGITAQAYAGYTFTRWLLDGSPVYENPTYLFMFADHVLQAEFSGAPPPVKHGLTITITGQGITDPPGNNVYTYDEGTAVTVTASALTGYTFDHWNLDGVAHSENPVTVLMDADHTLEAVFTAIVQPVPPGEFVEWPWQPLAIAAGVEGITVLVVAFLSYLSGGIT